MAAGVTPEQVQSKSLKEQREAIEKKAGKPVEELYEEREKRVRDAIQLKEPDRVPFVMVGGSLPKEDRPPASAAYYDPVVQREAMKNSILAVEPDLQSAPPAGTSGFALEVLDPQHMKWPGGTLPPDIPHQDIAPNDPLTTGSSHLWLPPRSRLLFPCARRILVRL